MAHAFVSMTIVALLLNSTAAGQQPATSGPFYFAITTTTAGTQIPKGLTKQLQATRYFFRGTAAVGNVTSQVLWSASNSNATVNQQGLVVAKAQGPVTIAARSGPLHASFSLTVVAPVVVSINIFPANTSIAVSSTQQFAAVTHLSDGTNGSAVGWSSSQQNIAIIDPNSGLATGVADGSATITATAANNVTATAVLNIGLTGITVTPPSPSIPLGTTQQFTATGKFSGGGSGNVTNDVVWTSSSPLIATISSTGFATSAGSSLNPTTITAASGSVSGSTNLTVTPPALSKIQLTPFNPALLVGVVLPFTATGVYTDGSKQDLTTLATWNSTNTAAATVGMNTGVVTTVSVGKSTISATYNGVAGQSVVSVRPGSRFSYVANQGDATVSIYALNENSGNLRDIGYAPNPSGQGPESMATDVNGKFLYLANAARSEITGFAINNATGELSPIANSPFTAGLQPSSVVLDPSSSFAYVSNQGSNNISAFSVDAMGNLTPLTQPSYAVGKAPTEIAIHPNGGFLYVANSSDNIISAFKVAADGSLATITGTPFAAGGSGPQVMVFDASGDHLLVLNRSSNQVNVFTVDQVSGALTLNAGSYAVGTNSLAMITDPTGAHVYASSTGSNAVYGFSVNSTTGALTPITGSPFSVPGPPVALAIDAAGFYLYAVNGNQNEVAILAIQPNGSLALVKSTRARSSPSAMIFSAGSAGQFLPAFAEVSTQDAASGGGLLSFSVDATSGALTLADNLSIGTQGANAVASDPSGRFIYTAEQPDGQISGFSIDNFGVLTSMMGSPFAGGALPFTLASEPSGRFLYAGELATSKNVLGFGINSNSGVLSAILGSPFSAGAVPLGLAADPTGRFLYATNFNDSDITAFAIGAADGALTSLSPAFASASPRALAVHPTGRFLYVVNLTKKLVQIFGIDPTTGALTGGASNVPVGNNPVSIAVDPEGRFLYTANFGDGSISAFTIDQKSGALNQITGAPYTGLQNPIAVSVDPSGMYLYAVEQAGNQVTVFSIDQTRGSLTQAGSFPAGTGPNDITITAIFR